MDSIVKKNIFLMGKKGIGKTTIINKIINDSNKNFGGFRSYRNIKEESRERSIVSFHMLNVAFDEKPNDDNLLFYKKGYDKIEQYDKNTVTKRFETLGLKNLIDYNKYDVIIMDELGPNEEDAINFHNKVIEVLDSKKAVLGVIQIAESNFLNKIKNRDDVLIFNIDINNRDKFINDNMKFFENILF